MTELDQRRREEVSLQAVGAGTGELPPGETERAASLWGDAWRQMRRRATFWIGVAIVSIFTVMAVAPDLFVTWSPATHDPRECSIRNPDTGEFQDLLRPSRDHWFGTDIQGCDYYVRVIHGARVSMIVGLAATAVLLAIGLLLGGIAGFYGGWADNLISRVVDVLFAFPFLIAAILILNAITAQGGRTVWHVVVVIGIFGWTTLSRIFRASVIQARGQEYVEAARALGARNWRILFRHVLPNAIAPAVVYATIGVGLIISLEATLSFLGVGLQLPAISWGLMINNAETRLLTHPHLLFFPGSFLVLLVLGFLILGDVVRDALDPRMK